jgi:hypothetical protein
MTQDSGWNADDGRDGDRARREGGSGFRISMVSRCFGRLAGTPLRPPPEASLRAW